MALIKCPECNKEDVSSYATVCPNCGFPIKDNAIKTASQENLKYDTVFYWGNYQISPMRFDNGLLDGSAGVHNFGNAAKYDYHVEDKQLYINVYGKEEHWTITPDYILSNESKLNGEFIDINSFGGSFSHPTSLSSPELGTDYYTFFPDGRYADIRIKNSYNGLYLQEKDLVAVFVREKPHCFVIYNNEIYEQAYFAPHRIEEVKNLFEKVKKLAENSLHTNSVKCPYCQSTNTKKISSIKRTASFGFFGFGSSKVGKQWHCNSCGSDF